MMRREPVTYIAAHSQYRREPVTYIAAHSQYVIYEPDVVYILT